MGKAIPRTQNITEEGNFYDEESEIDEWKRIYFWRTDNKIIWSIKN
jgi:hypothetical protein